MLIQENELLTPEELAKILGVSKATIVRWVNSKIVPAIVFKTGKRKKIRFDKGEIEEWLKSKTKTKR